MNAPSDSPRDPETGRVADPAVLAEHRARRAGQDATGEDDRVVLRRELEELLTYTEELDAALLAERTSRGEAERVLAADRDRAAAEVAQLREELERRTEVRAAIVAELAALREQLDAVLARTGVAGPEDAAAGAERAALRSALADLEVEHARTGARLATVSAELAAREAELQAVREEAEAQRAARSAAEITARTVRAQVAALEHELDGERDRRATLEALLEAERARASAELAGVQRTLHTELEHERAAAAERIAEAQQTGGALDALRSELERARADSAARDERQAAVEALVTELVATAHALQAAPERGADDTDLAAELEAERAARIAAEEELAREVAGRAAAAQRAADASDALAAGLERLRGAAAVDPDARAARPLRAGTAVSADHPALSRPTDPEAAGPREPPVVVVDLMRAAARLRAESEAPDAEAPTAARIPEAPAAAAVVEAPPVPGPTTSPWFATALPALAAVDAAAAERLLLAALPVQASRTDRDVGYELDLPVTGRHQVRVRRGGDVAISTLVAGDNRSADFRLAAPAAALAPLATGGAPKRLPGVTIRGRRRRLRRLLRALTAPVGLVELEAAGARPRADDLLALLCLGVGAETVGDADFRVAYAVGHSVVLVRATPDGRLTVAPAPGDGADPDATVTAGATELLGVLAGSAPAAVDGDAEAVATLHGWLRGVQGLTG